MRTKSVGLLVLLGFTALAGQDERDKKAELEKEIPPAVAAFKKACGCELKFDIKWATFKTHSTMRAVHGIIDNVQSNAATVCKDAEAKKAICQMKTMSISFAPLAEDAHSNPDPTFDPASGVMTLKTEGMSVPDLVFMAREILDK